MITSLKQKKIKFRGCENKQLLDEVQHDIMNYQNQDQTRKKTFSHSVSEENTPRGLVTRQTLNLT